MIKWFVYIVFLLVFTPCLLLADNPTGQKEYALMSRKEMALITTSLQGIADTVKTNKSQQKPDSKVKEVAKAKKQPKPEKVEGDNKADDKSKTKRQRRPDGMERPPEIPRRNDN